MVNFSVIMKPDMVTVNFFTVQGNAADSPFDADAPGRCAFLQGDGVFIPLRRNMRCNADDIPFPLQTKEILQHHSIHQRCSVIAAIREGTPGFQWGSLHTAMQAVGWAAEGFLAEWIIGMVERIQCPKQLEGFFIHRYTEEGTQCENGLCCNHAAIEWITGKNGAL